MTFWERIQRHPNPPLSLFYRLYGYQVSRRGNFDVAHDASAEVGQFSKVLGNRLKKVVVSEPSKRSLSISRQQLGSSDAGDTTGKAGQKYRFVQVKLEDGVPGSSGTVDFVFAANFMHWTDLDQTFDVIAEQLKPGGILLMGVWGVSCLFNEKLDSIWRKIFDEVGVGAKEMLPSDLFRRSLEIQDGDYDAIRVPAGLFEKVQRVKLNARDDDSFRLRPCSKQDFSPILNVDPDDQVLSANDPDWFFEADLADLKDMVATFPFKLRAEIVGPLWEEMAAALSGGKCRGCYPASIIMASRR